MFQQYYEQTLPCSHPPSDIAWIGSVHVFLFFVGVYTGRATDAGYFRLVFVSGVVLQLLGTFMTSLGTKYWQIFLSQAVCVGLGHCFTFGPALSVMSSYFLQKRALAVGLAAAGGATGGLVYPAVVNQLLYHSDVGFPWTMRVIGFIMLGTHIPSVLFFRSRLPPPKTGALVEWTALKEVPYVAFIFSFFFNFWGLYFVFFYLGTFARDRIGIADSINLVMVLNGVGAVGRSPKPRRRSFHGDAEPACSLQFRRCDPGLLLGSCQNSVGIVGVHRHLRHCRRGFAVSFSGHSNCFSHHLRKVGTRVGMVLTVVSFATLTGPAIEGALIQRDQGGYLLAQIFAATSILIGAVAGTVARVAKVGWKLHVKV